MSVLRRDLVSAAISAQALSTTSSVSKACSTSLATNSPQRILRSLMSTFTLPAFDRSAERKPRSMSWPTDTS